MDWKTHRLWIFAVALVALGGGVFALWRARAKEGSDEGAGARASLPHVSRSEIDSIEITRPHEVAVRLAHLDGTWRVVAPVDAKADQNAVSAALDKLAALESTGVAASRRENHARLEVDAEHGVRITATHGSHTLIDFWLGTYRSGGTMVRLEGQDTVQTVDGAIRYVFAKETKDWRDRAIVDITPETITAFTVAGPNGTYHFQGGPSWTQAPGDAPLERFSASKVASLVASVARLRATDFADVGATPAATGIGGAGETTVTADVPASDGGAAQHIVIHVGNTNGAGATDRFVQRAGDSVVYVVSGYVAERLRPHDADFQTPPDSGVPAAPPPGPAPEMPQLQMGGGGGQQIPPELMRQIQQQLQQRGAGGGGQ